MEWTTVAPMPTTSDGGTTGVIGNKFYYIGGKGSNNQTLNIVQIYDSETNTWSYGASASTAKNFSASAVVGDKIYVFGGEDRSLPSMLDITEVYDTQTDSWTIKTPMPTAGYMQSAVAYGTDIYVVGTLVNGDNHILIYDTVADSWREGTELPSTKYNPSVQIFEGKIYVIGGHVGSSEVGTDDVWIYDIATDTWSDGEPMPIERTLSIALRYEHKIFLFGGYHRGNLSAVDVYDIFTNSWGKDVPDLPYAVRHPSEALIGNKAYVIGGGAPAGVNTVLSIELPVVNKLYLLLYIGEEEQLSVSFNLPDNLLLDWRSTNEAVATVDENGIVTGVNEGTAYVFASDGNGYSDYIPVKVIEGMRLAVHLKVGETCKLYLTPNPLDVVWSSENAQIASVSSYGIVTAVSRGVVRMTGTIRDIEYDIYVRVDDDDE